MNENFAVYRNRELFVHIGSLCYYVVLGDQWTMGTKISVGDKKYHVGPRLDYEDRIEWMLYLENEIDKIDWSKEGF